MAPRRPNLQTLACSSVEFYSVFLLPLTSQGVLKLSPGVWQGVSQGGPGTQIYKPASSNQAWELRGHILGLLIEEDVAQAWELLAHIFEPGLGALGAHTRTINRAGLGTYSDY